MDNFNGKEFAAAVVVLLKRGNYKRFVRFIALFIW